MSRIEIRCGLLLGAGILIAMVLPGQAQSVPPCTPLPVLLTGLMVPVTADMKNAPFSATGKQTFEQKLPGGNAIHGVGLSRIARDSSGRTRVETLRRCWHGQDGNIHASWNVVINDSVAGKSLTWIIDDMASKVVRVSANPQPPTPEQLARSKRETALF